MPERRQVARFAHTSVGAVMPRDRVMLPFDLPRSWVWGKATGAGVRVCLIDSGVDAAHPDLAGTIDEFAVENVVGDPGRWQVQRDHLGDVAGHGTACAAIVRSLAPGCQLTSVRILGPTLKARGEVLVAALEWAVEQRFSLVNLSLSTQRREIKERLHDLADAAYFAGVSLVASAHNSPVDSYPWRFSSVLSVGAHERADPERIEVNPAPPVEFFASGVGIRAAWPGGGHKRVSGNSFAAPHLTGLCARILEQHPDFTTPALKQVLTGLAGNVT